MPSQPAKRRGGRGLSPSTPPTPPPLEDHSLPVMHCEAPLRQPQTMPLCLQPHGCFPSPSILYMIQMPPHIIMTFSLPNMLPSVSYNGSGIAVPTITTLPQNLYSWTLLLPTHLVSNHHQSSHSDVHLPDPIDYDADVEWD